MSLWTRYNLHSMSSVWRIFVVQQPRCPLSHHWSYCQLFHSRLLRHLSWIFAYYRTSIDTIEKVRFIKLIRLMLPRISVRFAHPKWLHFWHRNCAPDSCASGSNCWYNAFRHSPLWLGVTLALYLWSRYQLFYSVIGISSWNIGKVI